MAACGGAQFFYVRSRYPNTKLADQLLCLHVGQSQVVLVEHGPLTSRRWWPSRNRSSGNEDSRSGSPERKGDVLQVVKPSRARLDP
jgi:hypothetical protein